MFLSRSVIPALFLPLLVFSGTDAVAQRGAMTAQRNLAELTDRAEVIFRGQVLSAKSEPHPELRGLDTIVITLRVSERLKGNPGKIFTFRQFVWDIRDRFDTAGYRKGQELLLMINKPSRLGLTSTTGLEQGRFRITRDGAGARLAQNGRANVGLFSSVPQQLQQKNVRLSLGAEKMIHKNHGAMRLEELSEVIRGLVGRR